MKLTKKRIFAGVMTLALAIVLVMPTFVFACDNDSDCDDDEYCNSSNVCVASLSSDDCSTCSCASGFEPTEGGLKCECVGDDGTTQPCLPTTNYTDDEMDLMDTITKLINIVMSLLGFIAVIIVLIGGFKWMTAQGDSKKVDEAKGTISTGVVGLVIIFAAWGIARFVINLLAKL